MCRKFGGMPENTGGDSRRFFSAKRAFRQIYGSCSSSAKRVNRNDVRGSAQNGGEPALPAWQSYLYLSLHRSSDINYG